MKQTYKKTLFAAALFTAVLVGIVLALFPSWERHREQIQQGAMILRIRETAKTKRSQTDPVLLTDPGTMEQMSAESISHEQGSAHELRPELEIPVEDIVTKPEEGAEIGILEIPRIKAELPVTAGVSERQLKVSEGWVRQTDMVGSAGNAVVAGHRSYTFGMHFNRLDELEAGDEILFTAAGGEAMRFIVKETLVTGPDDPAVFSLPPEGEARLTLYTCTPVRRATHRLIVRALRQEG